MNCVYLYTRVWCSTSVVPQCVVRGTDKYLNGKKIKIKKKILEIKIYDYVFILMCAQLCTTLHEHIQMYYTGMKYV